VGGRRWAAGVVGRGGRGVERCAQQALGVVPGLADSRSGSWLHESIRRCGWVARWDGRGSRREAGELTVRKPCAGPMGPWASGTLASEKGMYCSPPTSTARSEASWMHRRRLGGDGDSSSQGHSSELDWLPALPAAATRHRTLPRAGHRQRLLGQPGGRRLLAAAAALAPAIASMSGGSLPCLGPLQQVLCRGCGPAGAVVKWASSVLARCAAACSQLGCRCPACSPWCL